MPKKIHQIEVGLHLKLPFLSSSYLFIYLFIYLFKDFLNFLDCTVLLTPLSGMPRYSYIYVNLSIKAYQ